MAKKRVKKSGDSKKKSKIKKIVLLVLALVVSVFFVIPLLFSLFNGSKIGNVALISVNGMILGGDGGGSFGQTIASSKTIVGFLEDAEKRATVKAVLLEINSPGGGAVASDEIASQIKVMKKPVVAVIREVGASGGYWIASASDHIIANRMSITGSIGVISSYLEFSELMKEYGVGYERLIAGKYKDVGTPFRKLEKDEKELLQGKIDKIHDFFIKEIAENRKLSESKIKKIATGEFFLGVEAYNLGLVDELGNKKTAEKYLKKKLGLKDINYAKYETKKSLLSSLMGVVSENFFKIGEGIGSGLVNNRMSWV
tara:strand:- start:1273 stop:2211 length:939 start_codon:yes stop_codon:yes gene_type:complete